MRSVSRDIPADENESIKMRTLKMLFLLLTAAIAQTVEAQIPILETTVYQWETDKVMKTPYGTKRNLFVGYGDILGKHVLKGLTIMGGKTVELDCTDSRDEMMIIVKYGPVHVNLNNKEEKDLDKGSLVFVKPGDKLLVENRRKDDVEIYVMEMFTMLKPEEMRSSVTSSFMIDWKDMVYKPHDHGGVMQLFDVTTVMLKRFDAHITFLTPGMKSHDPHRHINEEIILMIDGEGEMVLGEKKEKISSGDAAWVESGILHNITNIGKKPAIYYAIQWN